jgi:DNA-binding transcriptional regulator YhcF (GntR family)
LTKNLTGFDESKPIFIQIAESIEDEIINGELKEGELGYS